MNAPLLVDAHHHLWDLSQRPQPWLDDPAVASIRRTFTPDDLRATATHPIAGRRLHGTVVVQCVTEVAETEDLLALTEREPLIQAVVGWADLTSPSIGDVLDRLIAGPGGGHLRSLRHLVQGETDPDWLQRPDVERGLVAAQERGLRYDSCCTSTPRWTASPTRAAWRRRRTAPGTSSPITAAVTGRGACCPCCR